MLLQSVKLEEILLQCFNVIDGKKHKQDAHSFGKSGEPMLKAASKISTLLAQSFFVGFSVTVLAIIARLRVLVQQILIDVLSVFNTVSSISQQRQSIKIVQEGVDVFREYYPIHREMVTRECVWETDKFVLIERKHEMKIKAEDMPPLTSTVKYASIEAFLGENEPAAEVADP